MQQRDRGLRFNLRQAVYALSDALDLVGIDDRYHGKRVAFMAAECGRSMGMPADQLDRLLQEGILHDVGVSSTRVHRELVNELDWAGSDAHCQRGSALLSNCPALAFAAAVVRYHHSHWEHLVALDLPEEVRVHANLIFLTDRVDALLAMRGGGQVHEAWDFATGKLRQYRGSLFRPDLVDLFVEISRPEAFRLSLEPPYLHDYFEPWLDAEAVELGFESFKSISMLFSNCVDAKSPFTREHSQRVACLALALGRWSGLPEADLQKLEIAGLLHDLGKLRVPDEILDKPGPLDSGEKLVMERHSFDSHHILHRIRGLEEVALWASQHHEKLDGAGYPFQFGASDLSLQARILTVADIFQALIQNRPYRASMDPLEIIALLRGLVAEGKLDGQLVELVAERLDRCVELASGGCDAVPTAQAGEPPRGPGHG